MSLTEPLDPDPVQVMAQPVEKRKVIRRAVPTNQIPAEILEDRVLNLRIKASLPSNYNFEVHKVIWRIRQLKARRVALQFPEGLFIFSIPLTQLLEEFTGVQVIIMGDVTYGACCVDDFTASGTVCDLIIHFAHSCLVPVNQMINGIKVLYIFVDIKFDVWHLIESIRTNFNNETTIAMAATIQFVTTIHGAAKELREKHGYHLIIPQSKPLSPGEVLGCTAPKLSPDIDTVVFVADGRFHLEALMIANPQVTYFYRYNPYNKELTREYYEFEKMLKMREKAIQETRSVIQRGGTFGLILGTLGRQGSPQVFQSLKKKLAEKATSCSVIYVLIPEIQPHLLNSFKGAVDVWVQVACPRLSIDWGEGFVDRPLLTPYELNLALNVVQGVEPRGIKMTSKQGVSTYPMDFYTTNSLGDWTPNHKCNSTCSCEG